MLLPELDNSIVLFQIEMMRWSIPQNSGILHANDMSVNSDHFHAIDLFATLAIFINFMGYSV